MIIKVKDLFLLISLVLLQSCSGGKIGNFLESSFENINNVNSVGDNPKEVLENKKAFNLEKKQSKNNNESLKKESNFKEILENKKAFNLEKKQSKNNNESLEKESNFKEILENKKAFNTEIDSKAYTKNSDKKQKKRISKLQSYKIIFILKDVDPKDPIEELSTILRNSDVNFEIEKIERFFDSNTKTYKKD